MRKYYYGLLTALALSSPAAASDQTEMAKALALTPEHFRDTATLKDDALETTATITTENGYQRKRGLLKIVNDDNFLRAFVNKKTGEATFQVYQIIPYGGDWRFYTLAAYETPDGPKQVEATSISRDVSYCGRYGCSFTEQVGFEVDEALMRRMASLYRPGAAMAWKFKFKSKAGLDWNDGILPSEIVGMLEAVDAYRASHGLPAVLAAPKQPAVEPTAAPPEPMPPAIPKKDTPPKATPAKKAPARVTCITC